VMNTAFLEVIAAGDDARRDLFLITAGRLGTAVSERRERFLGLLDARRSVQRPTGRCAAPALQRGNLAVEVVRVD